MNLPATPLIVSVESEAPALVDLAFLLGQMQALHITIVELKSQRLAMEHQIAERDARIAQLEREVKRERQSASCARGALLLEHTFGGQF